MAIQNQSAAMQGQHPKAPNAPIIDSITIQTVSNGWMVMRDTSRHDGARMSDMVLAVFNSLPAMQAWISQNLKITGQDDEK